MSLRLDSIGKALAEIAAGRPIVVVDDEDRENEGDLIMAAANVTSEQVAFMIRHTSGILCTPLPQAYARRLQLWPMVADNDAPLSTAFTVSVDHRRGLTTGISAEERCNTIRALGDPATMAGDFVRPGHIFPLIAREGGVLVRAGHTEAAVDLAQLAGLQPVGLLAELVNDDGTVKKGDQIQSFVDEHHLALISIADLIRYRQQRETLVRRAAEFPLTTSAGVARAIVYATAFDRLQHMALVFGEIADREALPVRIHREQGPTDWFTQHGRRTIDQVLGHLAIGGGVFVQIRGHLLTAPFDTSSAPDQLEGHASTSRRSEDWREVGLGAQILCDLGVRSIRLLATHHRHYVGLGGFGIEIVTTDILD